MNGQEGRVAADVAAVAAPDRQAFPAQGSSGKTTTNLPSRTATPAQACGGPVDGAVPADPGHPPSEADGVSPFPPQPVARDGRGQTDDQPGTVWPANRWV